MSYQIACFLTHYVHSSEGFCFNWKIPVSPVGPLSQYFNFGGAYRDRTDDLKLAKLPLSQLSYGPFFCAAQAPRGSRKSARRAVALAATIVADANPSASQDQAQQATPKASKGRPAAAPVGA